VKRLAFSFALLAIVALAFIARCWPVRDVFVNGRVYFADPDCYSRMTRARMVSDGRAWVINHHDFENYPQGTKPHTTSPMDWLIAAFSKGISVALNASESGRRSVLRTQSLDLAGALVGPLLGVLTCLVAALALPRNEPGEIWRNLAAAFFVAISPIVVHGTLLGRPDHQALLIPLLALAIALELRLLRSVSQRLAVAAGAAWGFALWVSLYEPLVLLGIAWIGLAIFHRSAFR
jgi:asparagine N-glycosylation enzyme membrane subunit Stt3